MSTLTLFQIALEFWGVLFCFIAFLCLLVMKTSNPSFKKKKVHLELACVLLLLADCVAWVFQGQSSSAAYFLVRIGNFFVYFINYIYMCLFGEFLWISCHSGDEKPPKRLLLIYVVSTISLGFLIVSQFNHLFYYFDETNNYIRGDHYIISQILAVIGMVLCFSMLIQYRKRLDKIVFLAMLSYFVLPALATIFQSFHYGISFQNFAIVFSTQLMFAVDLIDISRQLDVSKSAFLSASHAASHDSMTGLMNKESGMKQIEQFLSTMTKDSGATLVFVDIDNFKKVNDTYGHPVGDFWIKEVAGLIKKNCRADDITCRYGGDEFIVFYKNITNFSVLRIRLSKITEQLAVTSKQRNQDVHCSMGICRIFGGGFALQKCVQTADDALYEAKESGKNTYIVKDLTLQNSSY